MTLPRHTLLVPLAAATSSCADDSRYAAWVSFDVGLLILSALMSGLLAAALIALTARTSDRRHLALAWLVAFVMTFVLVVVVINAVTRHPVFVVETVFPFP
jgi:hypothetical protein